MFRAALRIKTARVCLQTLKQLLDPYVIIGEPLFNVADITFLFVTSGKTLETDISAQIASDFRRTSGEGGGGGGCVSFELIGTLQKMIQDGTRNFQSYQLSQYDSNPQWL